MTASVLPLRDGTRFQRKAPAVADQPTDERALVCAAQRGEREAFSTLVQNHQRRAYAVARAIVVNHEDAEAEPLPG